MIDSFVCGAHDNKARPPTCFCVHMIALPTRQYRSAPREHLDVIWQQWIHKRDTAGPTRAAETVNHVGAERAVSAAAGRSKD